MKVVVRWARVDGVDEKARYDWLSDGERGRIESMRQVSDQCHFLGARLLLRHTLVNEFGCRPEDVALHQTCLRCGGPHGRPIVTIAGRPGPHVSLAHSGGVAMVGIGRRPLGVDLEPIDRADDLRHWVRTEAVLKATGHGLDVDPRGIAFSEGGDPPLVSWAGPGRRPTVRITDLDMEIDSVDFVAAVAGLGRRSVQVDARSITLTDQR